ncbi:MAG: nucleotide exchange factor GrpE [Puniceicoccales bacterium]|jgi:molecular chaperone GrpE|nr:nucleotide exchange factor GrpE [Puniceicoccales bacterium]
MTGKVKSQNGKISPTATSGAGGEPPECENFAGCSEGDFGGSEGDDAQMPTDGEAYLKKQLEEKQMEVDGCRDAMLRAMADLENCKKRFQRERLEIRNSATAEIVESLLPVLDNFEFGLAACEQHGDGKVCDGFRMIFSSFKNLLASYGLREIYPLNEKFDIHAHDCVRRAVDDGKENDLVTAVDRKGYKLNDRLLRPATVVVSCHSDTVESSERA